MDRRHEPISHHIYASFFLIVSNSEKKRFVHPLSFAFTIVALPSWTVGTNGDHGEVKRPDTLSNLLEGRTSGHGIFVRTLGDITVPSIASKEHLDGLFSLSDLLLSASGGGSSLRNRFNDPGGPQGLVVVCQRPSREVLAGSADHFDTGLVVVEAVLMLIPPMEYNQQKQQRRR